MEINISNVRDKQEHADSKLKEALERLNINKGCDIEQFDIEEAIDATETALEQMEYIKEQVKQTE